MVWVFKTSVKNKTQVKRVSPSLNRLVSSSYCHWNFDLNDCDKILRVEGNNLIAKDLINILNTAGFYCEELQD